MTAGSPERDRTMRAALAGGGQHSLIQPAPLVCLIADLVCPWCYISFMRLRRVLAEAGTAMTWHPFLLNPHLPPRGVSRAQYLERRFGSVAQAYGVHRRVAQVGDREGIPFAFGAIRAQPNTLAAHALVLAAAERGLDVEAAGMLFHAFFAEGANIGDAAVLARIGGELGLDEEEIATAAGPAAIDRVVAAHERAFALGIGGVPVAVFGDDHVIAGAQPSEVLEALLDLERYRIGPGPGRGPGT